MGVVLLFFFLVLVTCQVINAQQIKKIQTPTMDMLYFRGILKAYVFFKVCCLMTLLQLLCNSLFVIAPITMAWVAYGFFLYGKSPASGDIKTAVSLFSV